MGCGKSSVGRALSELLCCPFVDLDSVIEENAGRSIPEIFSSDGEAVFRRMEAETLDKVIHQDFGTPMILALGGGTVMTPECAGIVSSHTLCIYLRASVQTLVSHLENEAAGRPMLEAPDLRGRILKLMSMRSATYENTARLIIDTDGKTIEEVASEIISTLGLRD